LNTDLTPGLDIELLRDTYLRPNMQHPSTIEQAHKWGSGQ